VYRPDFPETIEVRMNQVASPPPSERDRTAAIVFAAVAVVALIAYIFIPPASAGPATLPIIRFLAAIASALSAFLFIGTLNVSGEIPVIGGTKLAVQAARSFGVFVLVFVLFFYGIPAESKNPVASVPERPAIVPPAPPKTESFKETLKLSERDTAVVKGVKISTGFIGVGSQGMWVDVAAEGQGGRLTEGAEFGILKDTCSSFHVTVKGITFAKPPGVSESDLRKMGTAAEALITREATLIVYGECEM
jgi:hypothetical protein